MKFLLVTLILFITIPLCGIGRPLLIDNFIVKENLTANGKLAIIAVDSLEQADEHISGTFLFTINGFEQSLTFHQGIAVPAHAIESSTFVYFKHKNQESTAGKLYFVYKKDNKLSPIHINGLFLIIIPLVFLFIAYAFKKFIYAFVVVAVGYIYLSYDKGLDLGKIIESAFDGLKNIF